MKKPIEPYKVYTVPEAAIELSTSEETLNDLIKKDAITARHIGKGYKILGENLLKYLGSPTIGNPLKTPDSTQIPEKEAQLPFEEVKE